MIDGKIIRRSLDTDVFTTAQPRLLDFAKEPNLERKAPAFTTFAEAQAPFETKIDSDVDWKRKEIIVWGPPTTGTKNSELRRVPMIRDLLAT